MLYNAYCQYILYTAYLDDIDYDVNGCEESIPGKLRGLSPWQLVLQSVERRFDPFVMDGSSCMLICPQQCCFIDGCTLVASKKGLAEVEIYAAFDSFSYLHFLR